MTTILQTIISTLYVSLGITILNNIPWTFIFLLTQPFGIRLYKLTKREECKIIQKRVGKYCSHMTDNDKGYGYSIGYWYIVSIDCNSSEGDEHFTIWLLSTETSYKNLSKDASTEITLVKNNKNNTLNNESNTINIFERYGSYSSSWFKSRQIKTASLNPRSDQNTIIHEIVKNQTKNKHTVVFIHGLPGSGKSMIGLLLANYYNGSYCNTLTPWQPGDTLNSLYSDVEPTKEKPLILALEEIDIALLNIHNGIQLHKHIPISIHNKTSWNHFFDTIQRGLYPNMIVVLTSNKPPSFINELDPSYVREGRVDLTFELNNDECPA